MPTLLMFPAARLPLPVGKELEALVLFEVLAPKVVVGTTLRLADAVSKKESQTIITTVKLRTNSPGAATGGRAAKLTGSVLVLKEFYGR